MPADEAELVGARLQERASRARQRGCGVCPSVAGRPRVAHLALPPDFWPASAFSVSVQRCQPKLGIDIITIIASHHQHHRHLRSGFHLRHMRPGAAHTAQFAALVVDGNTGRELYGRDENALRHPASITKVMTLYLLFEQLQKGRLHLDSRIPISAHAARQAPTKLGLRPGQTISVEDAIKAIVTQSANDIAVAVAEAIGGSEENFAEMMTRKAHALGMSRTHYANASGLPNDEQITTAHDLAILGRAVQERFPRYYHYFSTRSFTFHGIAYHNHNHLLGRVEGMDGIKTGYTRASGFNLLTSVKRDGHFIIAVVLGGASSAQPRPHHGQSHRSAYRRRRDQPLGADDRRKSGG